MATTENPYQLRAKQLFDTYATGFDPGQAGLDFWAKKFEEAGTVNDQSVLQSFLNPEQGSAAPRFAAMQADPDYQKALYSVAPSGNVSYDSSIYSGLSDEEYLKSIGYIGEKNRLALDAELRNWYNTYTGGQGMSTAVDEYVAMLNGRDGTYLPEDYAAAKQRMLNDARAAGLYDVGGTGSTYRYDSWLAEQEANAGGTNTANTGGTNTTNTGGGGSGTNTTNTGGTNTTNTGGANTGAAGTTTVDPRYTDLQNQYNALNTNYGNLRNQLNALQQQYDALVKRSGQGGSNSGGTVAGGVGVVDDGSSFNGTGGAGTTGPVWGPDGTMYSSIAAAVAAGVTNYSFTRPVVNQGNVGLINNANALSNIPNAPTGNANPGANIAGASGQLFTRRPGVQLPPGVPNPFGG